jgi:DNA-binding NarL/FixJ family response regulator
MSQPVAKPGLGAALYQLAEVHRVRGELTKAEEAYREAARWNRDAHLGLARLRFAQGQLESASAAIRRLAAETQMASRRAYVLDAFVEIVLAAHDVTAARASAQELAELADRNNAVFLRALSSRAIGAVLLAEHDTRSALLNLRQSWLHWCELQAPYEAARTRVLLAMACREMGDEDAAEVELAAARDTLQHLGASVDLTLVQSLIKVKPSLAAGPLTAREREVLKLVAAGLTNRAIAQRLFISEKTVARHISNIFTKLDLPSRAAATAYAYQNNLA